MVDICRICEEVAVIYIQLTKYHGTKQFVHGTTLDIYILQGICLGTGYLQYHGTMLLIIVLVVPWYHENVRITGHICIACCGTMVLQ